MARPMAAGAQGALGVLGVWSLLHRLQGAGAVASPLKVVEPSGGS